MCVCVFVGDGVGYHKLMMRGGHGQQNSYLTVIDLNRLYAKLIYANNRLTAKLILKDIAASTKRLCTAFVYNSQGSNGVQNIISKLFKHYKLLTKGRLAVWPYAMLKLYTKA